MTHSVTGAVQGFKLLASSKQAFQQGSWDIVDVAYGRSSDWVLRVEVKGKDGSVSIMFANPISFRVQDERDMMDYWLAR